MSTTKPRPYTMRRRAEQVEATRLRITEATVRLHTTVGPANTSIAAVAEEAGVTRLTVYRHFADLDELFQACTAHWRAQNPAPEAEVWASTPDLEDRARHAFGELYGWYRHHADALYPINRDAAAMPSSARLASEARTRYLADAILARHGAGATEEEGRLTRAVTRHLVAFMTWHSFAVGQGLSDRDIVAAAVRLLLAVA